MTEQYAIPYTVKVDDDVLYLTVQECDEILAIEDEDERQEALADIARQQISAADFSFGDLEPLSHRLQEAVNRAAERTQARLRKQGKPEE